MLNPIIRPSIEKYDNEIFDYSIHPQHGLELNLYDSRDSETVIECTEYFEVIRKQTPHNTGYSLRKKRYNLFSTVRIKQKGRVLVEFKWEKGKEPVKKVKNQTNLF